MTATQKGDYKYVQLNVNGKEKSFMICDLVAEYFLPKVEGKEYFITDKEFNTFSRGADGKMRIKFDAPQRKGYADGGSIIGIAETPLARDLGIDYTGLVGETGAMSSGEMFEVGGSLEGGYLTDPNFGDFQNTIFELGGATGLPEGTQQHFVNYYLGEGASQGIYANGGGMDSKLEAGLYRVGKPIKVRTNLYEQKIVEIFDNGNIATASDYARSLSDFKSMQYPTISKEQLDSMYMYGGNFFKKGGRMLTPRERYIA
jgi:hypothetical protein